MNDTTAVASSSQVSVASSSCSPSSLAQQIVRVLQMVLEQTSQESTQVPVNTRRPRGRPATLPLSQLWLALLIGTIRQARHLSTIWRTLSLEPTGSFLPVRLTYEAVRKRLQQAGTGALEELFLRVTHSLGTWSQQVHPTALTIASFATEIVALDESTLDALRRFTEPLRDLPAGDPHLLVGKLAGLFDLRTQRWMRLQFPPMCWRDAMWASSCCSKGCRSGA